MVKTVYAPITKSYRDENGDLVVQGIATSPDLDLDKQVCDPDWLKSAMPEWFEWGNLRSQHSDIPAGHATDMEQLPGDRWWIKGLVTNTEAAHMAEKGTYKGFSIAISAPRVVKDAKAKQLGADGGRIVGGNIVHVGLVDRPCNPVATLELAKSAKPGMTLKVADLDQERMLVKVCEIVEHPENADADETSQVGQIEKNAAPCDGNCCENCGGVAKGAMAPLKPGGKPRYPIENVGDLKDAIQAYGRAKASDKDEVRAHIISEAKRLGRSDLIPDNWTKAAGTHDAGEIAAIRDGLVACIHAELGELCDGEPELCDVEQLLCSLRMLMCWWADEAAEGEVESPYTQGDGMNEVAVWLAAQADKEKAMGDTTVDTTDTTKTETVAEKAADTTTTSGTLVVPAALTELVKTAVAEATAASDERVKALEAELAKVKATPVPGGPVIARTSGGIEQAARAEKAATYAHLAKTVTDRDLRAFYQSELKKLGQTGSDS